MGLFYVFSRVARTKTEQTAWQIVEILERELPYMKFCIVLRAPSDGCEITPVTPLHPLDEPVIKKLIAEFIQKNLGG